MSSCFAFDSWRSCIKLCAEVMRKRGLGLGLLAAFVFVHCCGSVRSLERCCVYFICLLIFRSYLHTFQIAIRLIYRGTGAR
jgi:hypothetical protein